MDTFQQCFLPIVKNLLDTEEVKYMNSEQFQFYPELNAASDGVVEIVKLMKRLVERDSQFSSGPGCSVPIATCSPFEIPTTRHDVS